MIKIDLTRQDLIHVADGLTELIFYYQDRQTEETECDYSHQQLDCEALRDKIQRSDKEGTLEQLQLTHEDLQCAVDGLARLQKYIRDSLNSGGLWSHNQQEGQKYYFEVQEVMHKIQDKIGY